MGRKPTDQLVVKEAPLMAGVIQRVMLRGLAAFVAVSPMLAILTCDPSAGANADTRPIVVLREDDCQSSWRTPFPELDGLSALEYGKSKQIPITWAIISSNEAGLTWAELDDYLDVAGGEPASHSVNHTAMGSTEDYVAEIVNSKLMINANLGPAYTCTTFLQPGPWTDDAFLDTFSKLDNPIGQAIQANYEQSLAYLGTGWRVGDAYYRYGMTNSTSVDYRESLSEELVTAYLDVVAATPGLIFIISCHGVQPTGGTASYQVPANIMRLLMDRLAELRGSGQVRLMGIHDAYHATFPPDLNHVPNPAFDVDTSSYLNPSVPWQYYGDATIQDGTGVGGSRCGVVRGTGSTLHSDTLLPAPGRYEVRWYQMCEPGYPLANPVIFVAVSFTSPYSATCCKPAKYPYYWHSQPDTWAECVCLLRIKERLPQLDIGFQAYGSGGFRVDDVSLVSKPIDPDVSPSDVSIDPTPTGCTVSWNTPNDPSVVAIDCRYGTRTHPLSLGEGILAGQVDAVPGTRQEMVCSVDWSDPSLYGGYFSLFASGQNGSSEPEIDYVVVDKTPPIIAELNVTGGSGGTADASWQSSDSESSIYASRYAVGTSAGKADVVDWTDTGEMSALLTDLPTDNDLYFSVKSQNAFGFWSDIETKEIRWPVAIAVVRALEDGTEVTVTGLVTAVFAGCCYIEQPDRSCGIRVVGSCPWAEGQEITLSGLLTTIDGERAIVPED